MGGILTRDEDTMVAEFPVWQPQQAIFIESGAMILCLLCWIRLLDKRVVVWGLGPIGGNVGTADQAQSSQLETDPSRRSFVACGYFRLQLSIVVHNLSI